MVMPRLKPLALSEIAQPLASEIQDSHASGVLSSTLPLQLWAHRPETASHWLGALNSFYKDSLLDERLRELVRLKIASITQCDVCQLARKSDSVDEADIACMTSDSTRFSADIQAALKFAELFATDYPAIDEEVFSALKLHFSTAAIIELNMFCALMLAGGRMTYVLQGYDVEN